MDSKEIKLMKIKDLTLGEAQVREKLNQSKIKEYQKMLRNGLEAPAILVVTDGINFWVADGEHRVKAAGLENKKEILCIIENGDLLYAKYRNYQINNDHGIPFTDKEKKNYCLLHIDIYFEKTNSALAKELKIGKGTVARYRKELGHEFIEVEDEKGKIIDKYWSKSGPRGSNTTKPGGSKVKAGELVVNFFKENEENIKMSNRAIAKKIGVDKNTVANCKQKFKEERQQRKEKAKTPKPEDTKTIETPVTRETPEPEKEIVSEIVSITESISQTNLISIEEELHAKIKMLEEENQKFKEESNAKIRALQQENDHLKKEVNDFRRIHSPDPEVIQAELERERELPKEIRALNDHIANKRNYLLQIESLEDITSGKYERGIPFGVKLGKHFAEMMNECIKYNPKIDPAKENLTLIRQTIKEYQKLLKNLEEIKK